VNEHLAALREAGERDHRHRVAPGHDARCFDKPFPINLAREADFPATRESDRRTHRRGRLLVNSCYGFREGGGHTPI
jgi:hypothetical protein